MSGLAAKPPNVRHVTSVGSGGRLPTRTGFQQVRGRGDRLPLSPRAFEMKKMTRLGIYDGRCMF